MDERAKRRLRAKDLPGSIQESADQVDFHSSFRSEDDALAYKDYEKTYFEDFPKSIPDGIDGIHDSIPDSIPPPNELWPHDGTKER